METLQLLGTVLGLTAMAGVNLYLTVFVTGLALRLGWLQLADGLQGLELLADPIILTVAGVLLAIELIIDKCPYADSGWDAIHTVIRPLGGAFLALSALGATDPVMQVVAVLLGGSVALTTHGAKAGSRLMINLSPEPATNIAASVGEDVLVLGGLWLAFQHPVIALALVLVFAVAFWWLAPRSFRLAKANVIGIWHRLRALRREPPRDAAWPTALPAFARETWLTLQRPDEEPAWVVPCFSGQLKPIGRNVRGCLLATTERRLFFIGRRNFRVRFVEAPLAGLRVTDDPGAVFHRLSLRTADGELLRVRFTRQHAGFVPRIREWLRAASPANPAAEPVTAVAGLS